MKKLLSLLIPLFVSSALHAALPSKSVDHVVSSALSVGTTTIANSNAVVDMVSSTKGFFPPRLTTTAKNSISGPSAGLSLYDSTDNRPNFYNGTGWLGVATLTGSETLTNKTLTTPIISSISNSGTLTLPTSTDTLVGRATTDTLTNKTLTAPIISTISNSGTLTLPTSTDTLVGRATTDTLTNKTLTAPTIDVVNWDDQGSTPSNPSANYYKLYFKSDGVLYYLNSSGTETAVGSGTGAGVVATAWASFTPVTSASNDAGAATVGRWRRVGDSMQVEGVVNFTGSGGAGAAVALTIPDGQSIDTAKLSTTVLPSGTDNGKHAILGYGHRMNHADAWYFNQVHYLSATTVGFNHATGIVLDNQFDADDGLKFNFTVPISGWTATMLEPDVVTKTANYTATTGDDVILLDASIGAMSIGLPTAVGNVGKMYRFKVSVDSANAITIDPNSTETICDLTTVKMLGLNDELTIVSDNTKWQGLNGSCFRKESAKLAAPSGGACAVTVESTNWINTVTSGATQTCTATIYTGVFSSAPSCNCTADSDGRLCSLVTSSATSAVTNTYVHDGGASGAIRMLYCAGPR